MLFRSGNYKIPGFRDVPQEFNVSLLKDVNWENLRTIQRSRGVGEPPLFMGSVVFFAMRDALKAARAQYGVIPRTLGEFKSVEDMLAADTTTVTNGESNGEKWETKTNGSSRGAVEDGLLRLESPATVERIRISCADPIVKRAWVRPKEGEKSFFVAI